MVALAVFCVVLRGWRMIVPLIVLAAAALMIAMETARQGRRRPQVRGSWARAILLNSFQVAAVWVAGAGWNGWMLRHRPWSADALGVTGGALVGYLAITFVYYWWHRWRHQSAFLWRWIHQCTTARSASRSSPVFISIPSRSSSIASFRARSFTSAWAWELKPPPAPSC